MILLGWFDKWWPENMGEAVTRQYPKCFKPVTLAGVGAKPERRASFSRRVAALLIDWGACLVIATVLFSPAVPWTPDYSFGSPDLSLIVLGLFVLETSVLVWLIQGSFGQRLVGLSVVSVLGRMTFWRSLIRSLLVSLVIPPLVMDEDGRGLQDRATGTRVVRA
jgi:hypothetical protein